MSSVLLFVAGLVVGSFFPQPIKGSALWVWDKMKDLWVYIKEKANKN